MKGAASSIAPLRGAFHDLIAELVPASSVLPRKALRLFFLSLERSRNKNAVKQDAVVQYIPQDITKRLNILRTYSQDLLGTPEPSPIATAALILGYVSDSCWNNAAIPKRSALQRARNISEQADKYLEGSTKANFTNLEPKSRAITLSHLMRDLMEDLELLKGTGISEELRASLEDEYLFLLHFHNFVQNDPRLKKTTFADNFHSKICELYIGLYPEPQQYSAHILHLPVLLPRSFPKHPEYQRSAAVIPFPKQEKRTGHVPRPTV